MTDPEGSTSSSSTTAAAGTTTINKRQSSSTIDLESVPRYQQEEDGEGDGTLITQLDIETLKLKPWRAPGVDVSDYFNYGFDEFTWLAYCHKQDKLRGEFNPQKVMENIMKGPGGAVVLMVLMVLIWVTKQDNSNSSNNNNNNNSRHNHLWV